MNLCFFFFVLPFVWLEKKHNNKVLTRLCGGKVCWFSRYPYTCSMAKLSQQHFRPLLARGCYGRIPSPFSTMTIRKKQRKHNTTKNLVIYNQSLCNWHATNCRLQLSWSYLQLQIWYCIIFGPYGCVCNQHVTKSIQHGHVS